MAKFTFFDLSYPHNAKRGEATHPSGNTENVCVDVEVSEREARLEASLHCTQRARDRNEQWKMNGSDNHSG